MRALVLLAAAAAAVYVLTRKRSETLADRAAAVRAVTSTQLQPALGKARHIFGAVGSLRFDRDVIDQGAGERYA